jgi:hypothetical protein
MTKKAGFILDNLGFNTRTFGMKYAVAEFLEIRFSHLASAGIMFTNEKHVDHDYPPRSQSLGIRKSNISTYPNISMLPNSNTHVHCSALSVSSGQGK